MFTFIFFIIYIIYYFILFIFIYLRNYIFQILLESLRTNHLNEIVNSPSYNCLLLFMQLFLVAPVCASKAFFFLAKPLFTEVLPV